MEVAAPGSNASAPAGAHGGRRKAFRQDNVLDGEIDAGVLRKDGSATSGHFETVPALPIAAVLFQALNGAGLKYGIVQDLASLQDAFAGRDDLDVVVDKRDYPAFCSIVSGLQGRRADGRPAVGVRGGGAARAGTGPTAPGQPAVRTGPRGQRGVYLDPTALKNV